MLRNSGTLVARERHDELTVVHTATGARGAHELALEVRLLVEVGDERAHADVAGLEAWDAQAGIDNGGVGWAVADELLDLL